MKSKNPTFYNKSKIFVFAAIIKTRAETAMHFNIPFNGIKCENLRDISFI